MNYAYQGDPAGSRSMTLTVRKINSIEPDGTWVTVRDEEDMECEVILTGLTPDMIRTAMHEWGH
jgi:hypothetical protein